MASRGLRAVSLSGWIVITGLLLCDFRGTVGCSHEFGVVRLGVERIRSRYARGTEQLQPISDLSDTLDQTTAAGSPRQPYPLLDGRLLLYCNSTSSTSTTTSTVLTESQSLSTPLRTSEGALLLCQPPSHPQPPAPPLASDLSLFSTSRWLFPPNTQISNQISRIRGTDAAMKLPKPRALFRSTACPHLACPH